MYRTRPMAAFIIAMAFVPALAAGQADGNPDGTGRRIYEEHDRTTRTSFTATSDGAGNAVLTLKGGDFVL